MMQLNQGGHTARDISKLSVYIKSGGSGFTVVTKLVIGISIFFAVLMLTIK